jgi:23S rRNA (cytosine1962-C5)-methyltransferase
MKTIFLKKGKADAVQRGHPWVFSGAISGKSDSCVSGDLVQVLDHKGERLGSGLFQQGRIAIKLLTFGSVDFNVQQIHHRIHNAAQYRRSHGLPGFVSNAFRLIHGEADLLPGLVIDIYDQTAVVHFYQMGMNRFSDDIVDVLLDMDGIPLEYILFKNRTHIGEWEHEWWANKDPGAILMVEGGIRYMVDPVYGQKTGFFLDQRNNRQILSEQTESKRVLNTFAYTGGFSLAALKGKASSVISVEISQKATSVIEEHIRINQFDPAKHKNINADVFEFLTGSDDCFDLIVLDPPAFAKSIHKRHNAIIAYKRLNLLAIKLLPPGGQLWTFSCSQVVNRNLFEDTIRAAALAAGKKLRLVKRLGQPEDHPVAFHVPETEYLKGLVLEVI